MNKFSIDLLTRDEVKLSTKMKLQEDIQQCLLFIFSHENNYLEDHDATDGAAAGLFVDISTDF